MGCCQSGRDIAVKGKSKTKEKEINGDPYESLRRKDSEMFIEPPMGTQSRESETKIEQRKFDSMKRSMKDLYAKMGIYSANDLQIYTNSDSDLARHLPKSPSKENQIEEPLPVVVEEEEEEDSKERYVIEPIVMPQKDDKVHKDNVQEEENMPKEAEVEPTVITRKEIEPTVVEREEATVGHDVEKYTEDRIEGEEEEEEEEAICNSVDLTVMQQVQIDHLEDNDLDPSGILITMVKRRNTLRKQSVLEPKLTKAMLKKGTQI